MLFRAQHFLLLLLPILMLLQDNDGVYWRVRQLLSDPTMRSQIIKKLGLLFLIPILVSIVILGFQAARFGNAFETGYKYLYEGRTDYLASRAKMYGLFSTHFLFENIYRTFFAFPKIELAGYRIVVGTDPLGNSLIFSQAILLTFMFLLRGLRAARGQSFILTSLAMAIPVWLYHNPGLRAPGYMRLSLDYLALWLATLAVCVRYTRLSNTVRFASVFLAGWAVLYLALLMLHG
jgi:hypothetical protein